MSSADYKDPYAGIAIRGSDIDVVQGVPIATQEMVATPSTDKVDDQVHNA